MGLFDFFKRGGGKTGGAGRGKVQFDEPRDQHYVFAHIALRQIAFKNPVGVVGVLHSPDGMKFLTGLWEEVGQHCREADEKHQHGSGGMIDGSTLGVRPARVGNFPSAIVSLPQPLGPTEAYFIALVLHVDLGTLQGDGPMPENPELSYYTLEHGVGLRGESRTVLCAWNAEEAHLNFGDGPPAEFEAFVEAVRRQIGGQGAEVKAAFKPPREGETPEGETGEAPSEN
ncbi:MAG TPA: hypothetical protein VFB66_18240 [Tepidisphaeraceae bacterium]|nr:hypothetical protein [Tepidisphaeraceae bacterium]